jgi:diguanylate cyclase (GGDEF)-like protein
MRVDYSRASRKELIAIIEMQERWHLAARFDPVTGVMNREGILGRLQVEMSRTEREGRPLGVGLADISGFRHIGRRRGPRCAETVLAAVAGRIGDVLRVYDRVGRVGGDEFLILAPGVGAADLGSMFQRVRAAVSREPVRCGDERFPVDICIGSVAFRGGCSSERLLSAVQGALLRERKRENPEEYGSPEDWG